MKRFLLPAPLAFCACVLFEDITGISHGSDDDDGASAEGPTVAQTTDDVPVTTTGSTDSAGPTCSQAPGATLPLTTMGAIPAPSALLSLGGDNGDFLVVGTYTRTGETFTIGAENGPCSKSIPEEIHGGFIARISEQGMCQGLSIVPTNGKPTYLHAAARNPLTGEVVVVGQRDDSSPQWLLASVNLDSLETTEKTRDGDCHGRLYTVAFRSDGRVFAAGACEANQRRLHLDDKEATCMPINMGTWFSTDILPTEAGVFVAGPYRLEAEDTKTGLPASEGAPDHRDVFVGFIPDGAEDQVWWRVDAADGETQDEDQRSVSLALHGETLAVASRLEVAAFITLSDAGSPQMADQSESFADCTPGYTSDLVTHPAGGFVIAYGDKIPGTCGFAARMSASGSQKLPGGSLGPGPARPKLTAHCTGVTAVSVDHGGQIVLDFLDL